MKYYEDLKVGMIFVPKSAEDSWYPEIRILSLNGQFDIVVKTIRTNVIMSFFFTDIQTRYKEVSEKEYKLWRIK